MQQSFGGNQSHRVIREVTPKRKDGKFNRMMKTVARWQIRDSEKSERATKRYESALAVNHQPELHPQKLTFTYNLRK